MWMVGAMEIDGSYMYGMKLIGNISIEKYYFSVVLCTWRIETSQSNGMRRFEAMSFGTVTAPEIARMHGPGCSCSAI